MTPYNLFSRLFIFYWEHLNFTPMTFANGERNKIELTFLFVLVFLSTFIMEIFNLTNAVRKFYV